MPQVPFIMFIYYGSPGYRPDLMGWKTLQGRQTGRVVFRLGVSLRRPPIRGVKVMKYNYIHGTHCRLDFVPPENSEMKAPYSKYVRPIVTLQHLLQVTVASQNEVFGSSSQYSGRFPAEQGEFSAAGTQLN